MPNYLFINSLSIKRGVCRLPMPHSYAVIQSIFSFTRFISGIINTQCSDNVILRRVRVTILAVENQKVLRIVCVCVCVCLA
jgi:hypothetical protein